MKSYTDFEEAYMHEEKQEALQHTVNEATVRAAWGLLVAALVVGFGVGLLTRSSAIGAVAVMFTEAFLAAVTYAVYQGLKAAFVAFNNKQ